ncbi:MAG: DUF11 domain-containing protein [Deltaproteobacteria bacterium]|nr:DUF11 domain-containing protein [Deltaproteobacteria bacterium]
MQLKKTISRSLFTLPFLFGAVGHLQAATITPNILTDPALGADPTNCSLRYAIESINNGATFEGGCATFSSGPLGTNDTIILGPNTYLLTLDGNDSGNQTGDLDVSHSDLTLTGAGSALTKIDASGIPDKDRVLEFDDVNTADITGITFTGGDSTAYFEDGGAIFANAGDITLTDVVLTNNTGYSGGGIAIAGSGATLLIDNSTIDHNISVIGGGGVAVVFPNQFPSTAVAIQNSTISNNQTQDGNGGGIYDDGEFLFLTNSTVSTNSAEGNGGGISSSGGLKGTYNVTIAFNTATGNGGGVNRENFGDDGRFNTQIFNTIIAKNTAEVDGNDCSGTFGTGGNNLIGDIGAADVCNTFTNGVQGDQVGTTAAPIDPLLGPLQFNGGATIGKTHALLTGSPAIDRGNSNGCQALDVNDFLQNDPAVLTFLTLTNDQRLQTRPVAILDPNTPICDIGAFEVQTFSFELTKDDGLSGSIPVGDSFTYTIVASNNGSSDAVGVTLNDPLPSQVNFLSLTTSQGTCSEAADIVSCDLGDIPPGGSVTVTITVSAESAGTAVNTATALIPPQNSFQASVTTVIVSGSNLLEGSGIGCSLNRQATNSTQGLSIILLLALVPGLMYGSFRRKA